MGVVAALLALDGTQITLGVLVFIPGLIVAVASLVSAWNSRAAKKELRPNGGGSHADKLNARLDAFAERLDQQDEDRAELRDDVVDIKNAISDMAKTVGFVMHEMAAEKVRAQYAEAELSARIDNERNH